MSTTRLTHTKKAYANACMMEIDIVVDPPNEDGSKLYVFANVGFVCCYTDAVCAGDYDCGSWYKPHHASQLGSD